MRVPRVCSSTAASCVAENDSCKLWQWASAGGAPERACGMAAAPCQLFQSRQLDQAPQRHASQRRPPWSSLTQPIGIGNVETFARHGCQNAQHFMLIHSAAQGRPRAAVRAWRNARRLEGSCLRTELQHVAQLLTQLFKLSMRSAQLRRCLTKLCRATVRYQAGWLSSLRVSNVLHSLLASRVALAYLLPAGGAVHT